MNIHWYTALSTREKIRVCEKLKYLWDIDAHPGSLLFIKDETIKAVMTSDLGAYSICQGCGAEMDPMWSREHHECSACYVIGAAGLDKR